MENKPEYKTDLIKLVQEKKSNRYLEEEVEKYTINKENRVTNKRISKKKTTTKKIGIKTFVGSMILVSSLSTVGMMQHIGTKQIFNEINNANLEIESVVSYPTSQGFSFYIANPDGSQTKIDTDKYLEELNKTGQEAGFTADEISIYAKEKYGVSHVIEGTTFLGRMKERFEAYKNYELGYTEGVARK